MSIQNKKSLGASYIMSGTHMVGKGEREFASAERVKEIQKAIQLIDKTPHMHGSDPGYIGGERASYFEWATENLLKTIKRNKPLDIHNETCGCNKLIIKKKDKIYFHSRAIEDNILLGLYDVYYYIIEFIQALSNEQEWDMLVSITKPDKHDKHEKISMFEYLPEDQKVSADYFINLENIISAPFDWKWFGKWSNK